MATRSLTGGHATELVGRRSECDVLDRLIGAVRGGESQALLVHSKPSVGAEYRTHSQIAFRRSLEPNPRSNANVGVDTL